MITYTRANSVTMRNVGTLSNVILDNRRANLVTSIVNRNIVFLGGSRVSLKLLCNNITRNRRPFNFTKTLRARGWDSRDVILLGFMCLRAIEQQGIPR